MLTQLIGKPSPSTNQEELQQSAKHEYELYSSTCRPISYLAFLTVTEFVFNGRGGLEVVGLFVQLHDVKFKQLFPAQDGCAGLSLLLLLLLLLALLLFHQLLVLLVTGG